MLQKTALFMGKVDGTPLGTLWLAGSENGLAVVEWAESELAFSGYLTRRYKRPIEIRPEITACAAKELREYLDGRRREFTIQIDWSLMRPFQQAVLKATFQIPYGQTRTYGELAGQIRRPKAARAVGRAESTNPLPLVIPCHRVIGADGKLHGYGGGEGLPTKEWLLKMEGVVLA